MEEDIERKLYLRSKILELEDKFYNPEKYDSDFSESEFENARNELGDFRLYHAVFKTSFSFTKGEEKFYPKDALLALGNISKINSGNEIEGPSERFFLNVTSVILYDSNLTQVAEYSARMYSKNHGKLKLLWSDVRVPDKVYFPYKI